MRPLLLALAATLTLVACKQEVTQDTTPVELTETTVGHYCGMELLDHPGPKAQVHLEGVPGGPLFFSQVSDAIAYVRAPEQVAPILAIYVNDMGHAGKLEHPGQGNWIPAQDAYFVLGSAREGGMGAPETVPFATPEAAAAFALAQGGEVLRLDQITAEMVLAALPTEAEDDTDTLRRLRALSAPAGG